MIARCNPNAKVVGIVIGAGDFAACQQIARGLVEVVKQQALNPLLIISSDMNHYASDTENRRLDEIALTAFEKLDSQHLYHTVRENSISMCGILPTVIVMEALRSLGGLTKTQRVAYGTSADASGDTQRVVGYAGMLLG